MLVPQKSQYAIRAIFDLARRYGEGPSKIADVAKAQAIPVRFLEVILSQLKQGGFVDSQRGSEGGYFLVRDPRALSVGEVLQFLQGPIVPVGCLVGEAREKCALFEDCIFLPMWERVRQAIANVYDNTTFQDLVELDRQKGRYTPSYAI